MLTIKNRKKLFTGFLPILLCLMLLAGVASPAVPPQTYAQGGDDLLDPSVSAVDFAPNTSLDNSDSLPESVPEDDAEQVAEGNTVYDEETPAESAAEDDAQEDTVAGEVSDEEASEENTPEDNSEGDTVTNTVYGKETPDESASEDDVTDGIDDTELETLTPPELEILTTSDSDFVVEDGVLVEYKGAGGDVVIPGDLGITTIGSMVFAYKNLTSVVIPEGVTTIEGIAFEGCTNLTTVVLPESVNKIGAFAFAECPKLTQINIPEAVTCIEQETFYRCYALTSITLPSGITSIGKNAFQRCEALTEIVIPANVTSIGDSAFSRCANLTSLTILSTETAFGSGVFAECPKLTIYGYSGSTAETYANDNSIPFVAIVDVTSVNIECDQQELKVGQTLQLTALVEPEGAMYKSVIWSSSNEAVAMVDEAGLVTAIAEGTATITVTITAVNGSFTDDITINVVPGVVVLEGETTPEGDIRLKFNKVIDNLAEGAENQFTVHVDGEIITVTDAISNETNDEIILVLETKITAGQEVSVDYIKSDETKWIKSKDNEVLDDFLALNINNHFLLPAPVLKADDTDNKVGEPIDLTFEDDPVWRAAITEVIVDGTPLQKEQYTVSEGKITIAAGVFTSAKTYNIIVKADRYSEATVVQTIKEGGAGPGLEDPPELTADTTNNVVGQPIELTFSDDSSWRNSISDITVNGASIARNKYSISAGIITIDAGVFTAAGSYTIVIKAGGYKDATVTQEIFDAGDVALTVTGPGVNTTRMFTQTQIESLPQIQEVYSCINTWPSKKWYVGKGVSLKTLLNEAGGIKPEATLIKFSSSDGYTRTLTVQELLKDRRYRFPNFKEGSGDADGHIPGDPSGAVEVETILGLVSAEGTDDPSYMNDANTPLLMLGQRAVTEQTGPSFVKYVNKIEVLTGSVPKWDEPTASVSPGEVPAGTKVELHSRGDDEDKVYYTLDGSIPDLNSPMYNWIAKRWWPSRGEETVAEINRPIELTKDTTIKAITIGPGKENSAVVTFEYKVIPAKPSESSEEIEPGEGGTVDLDDEAIIEIPAGALTGTGKVKVKIERVDTPPNAPSGFKLLSDVFEFTIDGKKNYNFNKKVTITLRFDPKPVGKGETPSIHRYDEDLRQWINLGGRVSDKNNTISVEVDHFSKFAVMVALPSSVTSTIKPGEGGTVSLGDEAFIEIPAGALSGSKAVEVKIERVEAPPAPPIGFKLLGDAFEFSIDGKKSYNFAKEVTITLSFDPKAVGKGETPSLHCYDEELAQWENLGGEISGSTISVKVDHFTKFAVMVELPSSVTVLIEPGEGGTVNLGNEVSLEIPPGALTGSKAVEVKIERVKSPPAPPAGFKLLSDVFEFTIDGKKSYRFAEEVTIKFGFDPKAAVDVEENPGINYYDEQSHRWVNIGGEVSGHTVTVQVDHFTKFAVIGKIKPILTDIAGHWAESNINKLVSLGAISGYPDGTFRPNNNITRAEFVTALVKAFRIEGQGGKTFTDTVSHWAKDSIAVAAASGIASGYDGDVFRPDDLITREQMAAMIMKAAKLSPLGGEFAYTDSDSISTWARQAVATVAEHGIMKGYPDNTVRPQGNATRAEAVTVIVNALPEP